MCRGGPLRVLLIFAFVMSSFSAAGGGWETYRGNDARTGVAGQLSDTSVTWTVDLGQGAGSPPTVVNDVLYVGGVTDSSPDAQVNEIDGPTVNVGDNDDGAHSLDPFYAIDARSGEVRWQTAIPVREDRGDTTPVSAPIIAGGTVYVGTSSGHLLALDANTGDTIWSHHVPGTADTVIGASPALRSGTLYVGVAGSSADVVAVDATTGERKWTYEDGDRASWSSPTVRGDYVYVGLASPTFEGASVVVALERESGEITWKFEHRGRRSSTPLVVGDRVVFGSGDGRLYSVDARTGAFDWATRLSEGARIPAPPSTDGNRVYVGDEGHRVSAIDLGTGDVVWRSDLESTVDTTPALADGRIHIVADDSLYVLDSADGETIWSLELGEDVQGLAPAVQGEQVFVTGAGLRAVHEGSSVVQESKETPILSPTSVFGLLLAAAIFIGGRVGSD